MALNLYVIMIVKSVNISFELISILHSEILDSSTKFISMKILERLIVYVDVSEHKSLKQSELNY